MKSTESGLDKIEGVVFGGLMNIQQFKTIPDRPMTVINFNFDKLISQAVQEALHQQLEDKRKEVNEIVDGLIDVECDIDIMSFSLSEDGTVPDVDRMVEAYKKIGELRAKLWRLFNGSDVLEILGEE